MPTASVPLSGGGQGISGRGNQRLAWNYSLPPISPWGTFGAGRLEVIPLEHWGQVVGHSQQVPWSHSLGLTTSCFLSVICIHLFPLLDREPSLTHRVFLTGPSWEPLVSSVEFNGCVCRCAIFVSSLLSGVGFYRTDLWKWNPLSLWEREMGSTWLVQSHQNADEKSPL